jgi:tetratricopeptide (TPR) repeat protein
MRTVACALAVVIVASAAVDAQQRRYIQSPAVPFYRAGIRLLANERWREAADAFERAIDRDPQYALAFYGLGRARIGEKQFVAAVGALERCAQLYMAQAAARAAGDMTTTQSYQDQIIELRENLSHFRSGSASARDNLTVQRIQDQISDLELAQRRGAAADISLHVPAFVSLSLGSAYFRRGSMAEAEREYRNAIKANSKMGEAYSNLAVVLLETERPDEALKALRDAERTGFRVSPQLKQQIQAAAKR